MKYESDLSWHLQDYLDNNAEPPERLLTRPEDTEGNLMSQAEIEEYVIDSLKTIRILTDQSEQHAARVIGHYLADLDYLLSIGRIDEDAYNELSNSNNFYF